MYYSTHANQNSADTSKTRRSKGAYKTYVTELQRRIAKYIRCFTKDR